MNVAGKVIVVTGGAHGMGAALAQATINAVWPIRDFEPSFLF
jgi:NAD(P)-dependent dehydrogenase (short-subunit alcohol dehydrogenase family)